MEAHFYNKKEDNIDYEKEKSSLVSIASEYKQKLIYLNKEKEALSLEQQALIRDRASLAKERSDLQVSQSKLEDMSKEINDRSELVQKKEKLWQIREDQLACALQAANTLKEGYEAQLKDLEARELKLTNRINALENQSKALEGKKKEFADYIDQRECELNGRESRLDDAAKNQAMIDENFKKANNDLFANQCSLLSRTQEIELKEAQFKEKEKELEGKLAKSKASELNCSQIIEDYKEKKNALFNQQKALTIKESLLTDKEIQLKKMKKAIEQKAEAIGVKDIIL